MKTTADQHLDDITVVELVAGLDGGAAADALADTAAQLVATEVEQVLLVAHWADLHNEDAVGHLSDEVGERAVRLGGDGTPRVGEFAAAELGVLLGMTTTSARFFLRDVLDLRHRHPLLWKAVVDQDPTRPVRFWQARQIVRATTAAGLSLELARQVDARTAPHLGAVPWGRMLDLVEAAVIEADPETAEQRRLAKELERFVRTGRSDEYGTKTIYARCAAGDAIFFLAMCDRIAQILADQGDDDSIDVRRSKAIGILATPARALAFLQQAEEQAEEQAEQQARESAERVGKQVQKATADDDHLPVRESDLHPAQNDADEPPAAGRAFVIGKGIRPDRFAPQATLYVHMSLAEFQLDRNGAVRVEGCGPVTLEGSRMLLRHCNVTVKPVIDPGRPWSVDDYETPAKMREQIFLAHPVEVFPHGTQPARGADVDHVTAYRPEGPKGQTHTGNLAPLARHHHRVKTHASGWLHVSSRPGVHYWRTRHGHWARVDHSGTRYLGTELPLLDQLALATAPARASPLEERLAALTA